MMRASNGLLLVAADRPHGALLQGAEELGLHPGGHLADLVEEERALAGLDEEPGRAVRASVKAPFTWPNSSLSRRFSGMAAQLMATNGPSRAAALRVERLGHELLARPALARDEHRASRCRRPASTSSHIFSIAGLVAEDLLEALRAVDRLPEALDLLAERAMPERPLDGERQLVHVERLGDEVVGAGADGGDRRLHVGVGRDDDDRHVFAAADELLAELDAVHPGHVHVGDGEPEVFALEDARAPRAGR